MSAQLWIYTVAGFFAGIYILWVIVSEIRLQNYAKSILHLEGAVRYQAEQIKFLDTTMRQYRADFNDIRLAAIRKKKGKRKR